MLRHRDLDCAMDAEDADESPRAATATRSSLISLITMKLAPWDCQKVADWSTRYPAQYHFDLDRLGSLHASAALLDPMPSHEGFVSHDQPGLNSIATSRVVLCELTYAYCLPQLATAAPIQAPRQQHWSVVTPDVMHRFS